MSIRAHFKLTREQRSSLFSGQPVKITFPGDEECPVSVGHIEVLSANVRLEVTAIDKTKDRKTGETLYLLRYTLFNDNLGRRFLAKQQGQRGGVWPRSDDPHGDEERTGSTGQYAANPGGGMDHEAGEAVDEFTQQRITKESRQKGAQATADLIAAAEEVQRAIRERAESSPEFKREARLTMHRIRRELDRFIERQKRKAA